MQRSLSSSLEPSPSPRSPPPQVEPWTPEGGAAPDLTAQNRLTRQAGGGGSGSAGSGTTGITGGGGGSGGGAPGGGAVLPRRLVVDMREFMSGLPAVLHGRGLQLAPLTLEVSQGAVVFRQDLQPALSPPSPP